MNKILETFQGKIFKAPPIWLMRQAGRYLPEYHALRSKAKDFIDFCSSPDLAVEVTLQPIKRFDLDAAIIFSDILIVPHALDQKVTFVSGKGPQLEAIRAPSDVKKLKLNHFQERISPTLCALKLVREQLGVDKCLIGFAGAPWTVLAYMIEGKSSKSFDRVTTFAAQHPQAFADLLMYVEKATLVYLRAQIEAGAQVLQLFDSWASLCPDPLFEKAVLVPTKNILKALGARVPILGFANGLGKRLADYQAELSFQGLTLDPSIDIEWAHRALKGCPVLQGGLDPLILVEGGKKLEKETRRYLDVFQDRPYIFNLGHGILPETPVENVQRVVDLVRERG